MDRVIRITSTQGFSDTFTNTKPPNTLNLCDFVIPRGVTVDLSKSYIAFNGQITAEAGAAPHNSTFWLDTNVGEEFNVPVSCIIRNASISNTRGQVESMRRVDTLNAGLFGLLDNAESRRNNLNTFADYEGGRGTGNRTSFLLDAVTDNVLNDGTTINADHTSRNLARDLKIPLSELFGVANSEAYSTDVMGETRIHLETNMRNLRVKMLGGAEGTNVSFDRTNTWGAITEQMAQAQNKVIGDLANPLQTLVQYDDFQFLIPFHVGQQVTVAATASVTGALSEDCLIKSIQYQKDNTTAPPSEATQRCNITVTKLDGTPFFTVPGAAGEDIQAITITAKVDQTLLGVINRAELVLQTTNSPPDKNITYDTYTTEEDVGNDATSFNRAYNLEAESTLWLLAACNQGSILPNRSINSYRFAINNEEETGNRDIVCNNSGRKGSALQYDRLTRALDHQAGMGFRNAQLRFNKQTVSQGDAYNDAPVSVIAETAPATAGVKVLNLSIDSAGLQDIKLYKQIQRTI